MATVFDGDNLLITLDTPVGGVLDVSIDRLYSEWKEWQTAAFQNMGYPIAFRSVGGDELTAGINAGSYFFLQNDAGWRITSTDADQTIFIDGNLVAEDSTVPLVTVTVGRTVAYIGLQPITQAVEDLLTVTQSATFNGVVSIDTVSGAAGTAYPLGTLTSPVSNLADAVTVADREGITAFVLKGTISLTQTFTNYSFRGLSAEMSDTVALNGQNVGGSVFEGVEISGAGSGVTEFVQCNIDNVSGVSGLFRRCGLVNNFTLAGTSTLFDCFSEVAGNLKPWISVDDLNIDLGVRGWLGGLELRDVTDAGAAVSLDITAGRVELDSTCTAGEVVIGGNTTIDDLSGVGCTVVDTTTRRQIFDNPLEGSETMEEMMRLIRAAAAGDIVQLPDGSYTIRDAADTKARISGDLATNNGRTITGVDAA